MLSNFYYVLQYSAIGDSAEYIVLEEYALHHRSRSLPDRPPPENLVTTHQRDGYELDSWTVVEAVGGDLVPAWPLGFKLDRE